MTDQTDKRQFWKLRHFGLTIVLLFLFLLSIGGQFFYGFKTYNEEKLRNHEAPLTSMTQYATEGHFLGSVGENMESEFLQMFIFVVLTMHLYQKGSAESRKPEEELTEKEKSEIRIEREYQKQKRKEHPVLFRLYENSLSITLALLFVAFFMLHAYGSVRMINEDRARDHETMLSFWQVFGEAEFWFESFQNWQSEFFSIAAIVILSIFLRQKSSAQSKKMNDPHWKTGDD